MGSHQQEVAILMFLSIGMLQAQPALTILNGVSNVACGTRTQITCNVTSNSFSVMYWYANGNELAQCIITQCAASALPSNYKLSNTGQTFYLEIDPVKISDNITIECSDGQPSNAITLSPRTIISNGTLTSSKHVVGTNVEITTETNCVLNANDVTFVLTKKKSTEQHFVPDNKHTPTKSIKPCTNIDNPNCGGTKSSRVIIMTEFKNDSSGNSYTFMLKVTQYGADSWIPLGTYTIADYSTHTTSTMGTIPTQSTEQTSSLTSLTITDTSTDHLPTTGSQFSTSTSSKITDTNTFNMTTIGSLDKQSAASLNEPVIYLIVGCVVLIVVTIACVANVGYIIYRKRQKEIKTLDESDAVSNAVTSAGSQVYNAIEQQSDLQTEQTSEQL